MARRSGGGEITVITPTRNMASHLQNCIQSVAAQGVEVEHIIVDGVSTDGTVELLRRSQGLRWISEPDKGQSEAINKGFAMATGDIIGWLNADDELLPGTLQAVNAAFEDPSVGWVYGDMLVSDGTREWMEKAPTVVTWETMARGNVVGQPGSFYARWALDRVGPLDTSFHYTMDFELFLRFLRADIKSVHLGRPVARFHLHEGSKSGSVPAREFAEDESRALLLHGDRHAAAMAIDRWFWHDTVGTLKELLENGDRRAAQTLARERLGRMQSVRSRVGGFVWLTARAPRLAPLLLRLRRTQRS
jgi:glycosyltransferase involved in cell wall biosynthesis